MTIFIVIALVCLPLTAQTFDAASIRASEAIPSTGMSHLGCTGGPGTNDPGLFKCTRASLRTLVTTAYHLRQYELSGPDWLDSERFEIRARVPLETTRDELHTMLQNLLRDRFGLRLHHETRALSVYDLVVAKDGPKLTLTGSAVVPPDAAQRHPTTTTGFDKDGFPILPDGGPTMTMMLDRSRMRGINEGTGQLAGMLSNFVSKPVIDATGLTGKYDYTLTWATQGQGITDDAGRPPLPSVNESNLPDIFTAVQEQLGLRLVQKKGPVDIVVVDHIEKTPTAN